MALDNLSDIFGICRCIPAYTIEGHGKQQVLYYDRCMHKHGYNLAVVTKVSSNMLMILNRDSRIPTAVTILQLIRSRPLGEAKLGVLAKQLGTHSNSIVATLKLEHTSFGSILTKERQRVLLLHLNENPKINASELAELVGYSGPDVLSQAVKRWTGDGYLTALRKRAKNGKITKL